MVVASPQKDPVTVDFVVVVEATANMVTHWEMLKKSYIMPAIEYFNGRPPSGCDYTGNHGSSQFSYVLFHSMDQIPDPVTVCSRPMNSPWNFVRALDAISFNGGGCERSSQVAEGLARALELFDGLSKRRGTENTAKKVCFLVCNSPPYDLPCYESTHYPRHSAEQLAEIMGTKGINLSVISPQNIPSLRQLYLSANQNKAPTVNYAQDARHLVYISGFTLPTERDPIKLNQANEQKPSPALNNNIPTSLVTSSTPSTAQHQSPSSTQSYSHSTSNLSLSPGNLQQTASSISQTMPGLTDTATGISTNAAQGINASSAQPNQTVTTTQQTANVQVGGLTANNISSPSNMIQSSQQNIQPLLPLNNQQQMLGNNFSAMNNNSSSGMVTGTTTPFSRAPLTSNITSMASTSSNNTNIKNLLGQTQAQILLPSPGNSFGGQAEDVMSSMAGMSGTSVPETTSQVLFTNSNTGMQTGVPGIKDQQGMTPQSGGVRMTLPNSSSTVSTDMRGNMQQVPPYSNSSSVLSQVVQGQNNQVSFNTNQQQQQQMNQPNNQVGVRNNMMQNFNNPTGVMDVSSVGGQPMNNQMQNQVQMSQQQMMGQQQQDNILNSISNSQQPSTGFMTTMGAGQQVQNNSTVTTSFQQAKQVAKSVMEQARMSTGMANLPNNPRFPNPPTGMQQPMQMQQPDLRCVWSGTLEWTEKRKLGPGVDAARTTRALNCQVCLQGNQTDEGINANTWPDKLNMQLIPHIVFSNMQNQVKNNRSVNLRMAPSGDVTALANIMKSKWIGLIQIPSPNSNPVDNKVMLVIYSQKKSQFFGLLPVDPHSFITTIRKVIAKHQPRMQPNQTLNHQGQSVMMPQFQQDGMNRPQPNQVGQQNQFQMHNQVNPRPAGIPNAGIRTVNTMHQNVTMVNPGGIRGINSMNQGVPVQSNVQGQPGMTNQQRIMEMNYRQQQGQRMSNPGQMGNQSTMMSQQQQQTQQLQQQQGNMGQPQMQQAGNPTQQQQFMYSNINQRNMVSKQGMGQVDQNSDVFQRQQQIQRIRMQQQQQQQQTQQVQRSNMMGGTHGMGGSDHDQLRNLLQSGTNNMGQTMNTQQRPRMMMNTGMRQGMNQTGMRANFMQNPQVRHAAMTGNRMMGMQQPQQQRFTNMQQNQQQPPMM